MLLQHYKLVMGRAGLCPCQATPLAVAQLSDNISGALLHLNKVIKGCAYNPEENILSFLMEGKKFQRPFSSAQYRKISSPRSKSRIWAMVTSR